MEKIFNNKSIDLNQPDKALITTFDEKDKKLVNLRI